MKTRDTTLSGLAAMVILATMVNSAELAKDLPANDKESIDVPSLALEARDDREGTDLDSLEGKSAPSFTYADEPGKPIILGSTSKVAVVYSEGKSATTEKSVKPISRAEDRSWRVVKAAPRDSYLDALSHSHSSKDPREGVVGVDSKPKISKVIRREYSEGPVYRPVGGQHAAPTHKPSFSYGPPTEEPFLPTPSDAYSLPVQSFGSFDDNHGSYAPPHNSYGSPSAPDTSYGPPSHHHKPASISQNSFGPSSNGYSGAGSPQQVYGRPAPAYGAPYAIQDYSQHLPSLPSIDFSWPFALKLNAFTLAKILLKLVIFKMIVKFIALICLLLFIPKLEIIKKDDKNDNDNDDDARRLGASDSAFERLNVLTALVTSSIEKYEDETGRSVGYGEDCTSLVCRMRKLISGKETWNDYARLLKSYITEETDKDEDNSRQTNRLET